MRIWRRGGVEVEDLEGRKVRLKDMEERRKSWGPEFKSSQMLDSRLEAPNPINQYFLLKKFLAQRQSW